MSVQHKKTSKLDNQDHILVKKGLAAIAGKFLETRKVRLRDGKGFFLFIRILIFSKNASYFVIDPYPFPPIAFQKVVLKQKLTEIFIVTALCGASKGFMKALNSWRSVKL